MYFDLSEDEQDRVIAAVRAAVR